MAFDSDPGRGSSPPATPSKRKAVRRANQPAGDDSSGAPVRSPPLHRPSPRPDEARPGAEAMPETTMTTTQPTPISVHGLTKQFGRIRAVEELTFDVRPGQITGFLGPNGAGKTTTLRMLLGLVHPTSGVALVLGEPPGAAAGLARIGAMVETP